MRNLLPKSLFHSHHFPKKRSVIGIFVGIAISLPVSLLFLLSVPQELMAQSSNPWNLYNNPTYGNALDISLGPSTVDPPPVRIHSNGNMMVRTNIILGQTQAINSQTWTSTAKGLIFNSASTPWWIRQNASDTTLAFGSSTSVVDSSINFSIGSNGYVYLPKANSRIILPEISANTGGFTGISSANGDMSDGVPYYGAWGRELGAWSGTFPDFVLNNHTGVRIAAHGGYGGVAIYEELNPAGTVWSSSGNELARFRDNRYGASYINTGLTVAGANTMGNGYNGLTQAYGNYIWPGRLDGSGGNWQQAWYLGSHSSYGLYTNTGVYISGTSWAPFIYDSQDTNYYVDPNSVSSFNDIRPNILYDRQNTGYYLDPNATSNLNTVYRYSGFNGPEYDANNTGYYIDPNSVSSFADLRSSYYYDNNNTGYYMDLDQQTHMNVLYPNSINCMSSWCPPNQVMRLTPNLHLNSVNGYAVYLNWDNANNGCSCANSLIVGKGDSANIALQVRADGYTWINGPSRLEGPVGVNGYASQGCGGYGLCVGGAAYAQSGWAGSDSRLKKDITPISGALETLTKLEGITYRLKDESKDPGTTAGKHFGFIAQQVEPFIPEAISTNPEGYKAMDYASLTALLTEGIKEQQNQIKTLNESLKSLITNTENEQAIIKQEVKLQQETNNSQDLEIKLLKQEIELLKQEIKSIKNK